MRIAAILLFFVAIIGRAKAPASIFTNTATTALNGAVGVYAQYSTPLEQMQPLSTVESQLSTGVVISTSISTLLSTGTANDLFLSSTNTLLGIIDNAVISTQASVEDGIGDAAYPTLSTLMAGLVANQSTIVERSNAIISTNTNNADVMVDATGNQTNFANGQLSMSYPFVDSTVAVVVVQELFSFASTITAALVGQQAAIPSDPDNVQSITSQQTSATFMHATANAAHSEFSTRTWMSTQYGAILTAVQTSINAFSMPANNPNNNNVGTISTSISTLISTVDSTYLPVLGTYLQSTIQSLGYNGIINDISSTYSIITVPLDMATSQIYYINTELATQITDSLTNILTLSTAVSTSPTPPLSTSTIISTLGASSTINSNIIIQLQAINELVANMLPSVGDIDPTYVTDPLHALSTTISTLSSQYATLTPEIINNVDPFGTHVNTLNIATGVITSPAIIRFNHLPVDINETMSTINVMSVANQVPPLYGGTPGSTPESLSFLISVGETGINRINPEILTYQSAAFNSGLSMTFSSIVSATSSSVASFSAFISAIHPAASSISSMTVAASETYTLYSTQQAGFSTSASTINAYLAQVALIPTDVPGEPISVFGTTSAGISLAGDMAITMSNQLQTISSLVAAVVAPNTFYQETQPAFTALRSTITVVASDYVDALAPENSAPLSTTMSTVRSTATVLSTSLSSYISTITSTVITSSTTISSISTSVSTLDIITQSTAISTALSTLNLVTLPTLVDVNNYVPPVVLYNGLSSSIANINLARSSIIAYNTVVGIYSPLATTYNAAINSLSTSVSTMFSTFITVNANINSYNIVDTVLNDRIISLNLVDPDHLLVSSLGTIVDNIQSTARIVSTATLAYAPVIILEPHTYAAAVNDIYYIMSVTSTTVSTTYATITAYDVSGFTAVQSTFNAQPTAIITAPASAGAISTAVQNDNIVVANAASTANHISTAIYLQEILARATLSTPRARISNLIPALLIPTGLDNVVLVDPNNNNNVVEINPTTSQLIPEYIAVQAAILAYNTEYVHIYAGSLATGDNTVIDAANIASTNYSIMTTNYFDSFNFSVLSSYQLLQQMAANTAIVYNTTAINNAITAVEASFSGIVVTALEYQEQLDQIVTSVEPIAARYTDLVGRATAITIPSNANLVTTVSDLAALTDTVFSNTAPIIGNLLSTTVAQTAVTSFDAPNNATIAAQITSIAAVIGNLASTQSSLVANSAIIEPYVDTAAELNALATLVGQNITLYNAALDNIFILDTATDNTTMQEFSANVTTLSGNIASLFGVTQNDTVDEILTAQTAAVAAFNGNYTAFQTGLVVATATPSPRAPFDSAIDTLEANITDTLALVASYPTTAYNATATSTAVSAAIAAAGSQQTLYTARSNQMAVDATATTLAGSMSTTLSTFTATRATISTALAAVDSHSTFSLVAEDSEAIVAVANSMGNYQLNDRLGIDLIAEMSNLTGAYTNSSNAILSNSNIVVSLQAIQQNSNTNGTNVAGYLLTSEASQATVSSANSVILVNIANIRAGLVAISGAFTEISATAGDQIIEANNFVANTAIFNALSAGTSTLLTARVAVGAEVSTAVVPITELSTQLGAILATYSAENTYYTPIQAVWSSINIVQPAAVLAAGVAAATSNVAALSSTVTGLSSSTPSLISAYVSTIAATPVTNGISTARSAAVILTSASSAAAAFTIANPSAITSTYSIGLPTSVSTALSTIVQLRLNNYQTFPWDNNLAPIQLTASIMTATSNIVTTVLRISSAQSTLTAASAYITEQNIINLTQLTALVATDYSVAILPSPSVWAPSIISNLVTSIPTPADVSATISSMLSANVFVYNDRSTAYSAAQAVISAAAVASTAAMLSVFVAQVGPALSTIIAADPRSVYSITQAASTQLTQASNFAAQTAQLSTRTVEVAPISAPPAMLLATESSVLMSLSVRISTAASVVTIASQAISAVVSIAVAQSRVESSSTLLATLATFSTTASTVAAASRAIAAGTSVAYWSTILGQVGNQGTSFSTALAQISTTVAISQNYSGAVSSEMSTVLAALAQYNLASYVPGFNPNNLTAVASNIVSLQTFQSTLVNSPAFLGSAMLNSLNSQIIAALSSTNGTMQQQYLGPVEYDANGNVRIPIFTYPIYPGTRYLVYQFGR